MTCYDSFACFVKFVDNLIKSQNSDASRQPVYFPQFPPTGAEVDRLDASAINLKGTFGISGVDIVQNDIALGSIDSLSTPSTIPMTDTASVSRQFSVIEEYIPSHGGMSVQSTSSEPEYSVAWLTELSRPPPIFDHYVPFPDDEDRPEMKPRASSNLADCVLQVCGFSSFTLLWILYNYTFSVYSGQFKGIELLLENSWRFGLVQIRPFFDRARFQSASTVNVACCISKL
jgi:hypothetical protein